MRITFNAWIPAGHWSICPIENPNGVMIKEYQNHGVFEDFLFSEDGVEYLQYIGLKDKNGKEIYEFDIVNLPTGELGVIEFDKGLFGINLDFGTDRKTMLGSWGSETNLRQLHDGYYREIEVIGNIYENPELLKQ